MTAFDLITAALAIASIVWLGWMASRGFWERTAEDDARAFFDEHGHWPGEDPVAVEAFARDHNAAIRDPASWDSDPAEHLKRERPV
jgi:hypothetical protein